MCCTTRRDGPRARAQRPRGFSLIELLVVIAFMGLALAVAFIAWQNSRGRAEAKAAARLTKVFIHKARMNSIYQGVNHFVVVDSENKRIEIYADTGTTPAVFDNADPRVAATNLSTTVTLSLPSEPTSLSSPLDSTTLSSAWTIPAPDSSARWGSELLGLMTTPTGLLKSAQSTPTTIGAGIIVFTDVQNHTSAVGIRGREGTVRSFEYFNDQWKEL